MESLQQAFVLSAAFAFVMCLAGMYLTRRILFKLGRGSYCGAFPFFGGLLGSALALNILPHPDFLPVFLGFLSLAVIGFLRDFDSLSYSSLIPYSLLIVSFTLIGILPPGFAFVEFLTAFLWVAMIMFCLKLSALVYEMPFLLISLTSLSSFLFFLHNPPASSLSMPIISSLCVCGFGLLFAGKLKEKSADSLKLPNKRFLLGSSGIFSGGFLLGIVTVSEQSPGLVLLGLCIPSVVIFLPFIMITGMIVFSYIGNKLHMPENNIESRAYSWSLKREKTVLFAGLMFLCLNFAWLILSIKTPLIALIMLLLLLSMTIGGFLNTFIRRKKSCEVLPNRINIMGISIDALSPSLVVDKIAAFVDAEKFAHVITADSLALVRADEDNAFKAVFEKAELVVPDGAGIVWASDFLGLPLPGRVPGVALVAQISERAAKEKYRMFFVGGKPGVANKAVDVLKENNNIDVCGVCHGFFKKNSADEEKIIRKIIETKAQIVFVALGVPRQEWFITKLREYNANLVAIGVGGSFDVISKELPRAPIFMQRFALEWLFRLCLEPSRFSRMIKIPLFVLKVLRQKWNSD
ncbi:WecB/TagA/CpsF family glycosyltransferase [bacterium]|nr:WecB/TagA/CpsF family glycosyltransferase [bacterium]